jgi:3-oxoacyl-[acyl-carrier protein] reductase
MDIAGGVAIITGSSSGVGAVTARLLAEKGCNIVVNYRENAAGAAETARACEAEGIEAVVVQADVASDEDCRRLAGAATEKWGRIDALVNNAGTTRFAEAQDLEALSADDFAEIFAVNVTGPYMMIRAVAPHMKAAGRGTIVNVSSLAAVTGQGSSVAYSASKGALNTMTLTLARALAPEIRVNCCCPAMIDTRWNRAGLGDERYEALLDNVKRTVPLRHALEAEDVARTLVWLVEGADYITGEVIMVDSGMHLGMAPTVAR